MWDMDWIEQAEDRDRWWAFVSAVIKFLVVYIIGKYFTSVDLVGF